MTSGNSTRSTPVAITVGGLIKEHSRDPETFSATLEFASEDPITEIRSRIKALGFKAPLYLESTKSPIPRRRWGFSRWWATSTKSVSHPYVEIEVVAPDEPSDYASKRISIDDPFIKFANQPYQDQATLKFELNSGDLSEGTDATEKLVVNEDLEICFHRTLRMPDDNRLHQLPASLGQFPLFNVEEYGSRLMRSMTERGGIFFPMWQREAMWIGFTSRAGGVYAVRAFVGNVNAISGLPMDEPNDERKQDYNFVPPYKWIGGRFVAPDEKQDYIVVPQQKWIDGICVAPGVVRQFVAMPLGTGYTVEGQIMGEEKLGGLKFEVIPAYRLNLKYWSRSPRAGTPDPEHFYNSEILLESQTPREEGLKASEKVRAYPNPPTYDVPLTVSDLLAELPAEGTQVKALYSEPSIIVRKEKKFKRVTVDSVGVFERRATDIGAMGLAAGGKVIQDIARDIYAPHNWNKQEARLINIHILDPSSFEHITHMVPSPPPMDAKAYTDAHLPFYVIQEDVDNRLDGGKFDNVLSVSGMDKKVGVTTEPEFDPFNPKMCRECSLRLCDCIVRPCDHQFCNVCIGKLDDSQADIGPGVTWKCPTCASEVAHVAGFSAPMNLPGEEVFKANVQVTVLKPHDGSLEFQSIYTTRL